MNHSDFHSSRERLVRGLIFLNTAGLVWMWATGANDHRFLHVFLTVFLLGAAAVQLLGFECRVCRRWTWKWWHWRPREWTFTCLTCRTLAEMDGTAESETAAARFARNSR
jgi:hypothetical protein